MNLSLDKQGAVARALASKSALQVGLDFGFDKHYKDLRAVRNAVNNIYQKVKKDPNTYGIGEDVLNLIEQGLKTRSLTTSKQNVQSFAEKQIDKRDINELVQGARDKAFRLIDKKLDRVSNSKKKLDAVSFKDLGTIAGISFDKTRILQGEATEHIAVLGKIEEGMTPQQMLDMVLKLREGNVASKHEK